MLISRKKSIAGGSSETTIPTVVKTEIAAARKRIALDELLAPADLLLRERVRGGLPATVSWVVIGRSAARARAGRPQSSPHARAVGERRSLRVASSNFVCSSASCSSESGTNRASSAIVSLLSSMNWTKFRTSSLSSNELCFT